MPPRKGSSSNKIVGPSDLLSNLPKGIITKILSHVPIREAVRTSVLSSQWRYTWCYIPNLKFDDSCVNLTSDDEAFASFVYRVLLLHQGPVHKFEIFVNNSTPEFSDINQWVTFLSRNGIKELSLEFGSDVNAPSSLFQCSKLTTLSLYFLEFLELPVSFEGFKSLKSLVLESVPMAECSLEKLISGCPLLENLKLRDSHSEVFKIHAPFLKYLYLYGEFEGFILEKTPLLEEIIVSKMYRITENSCTLTQFIDQVPLLQKLTGLEYFAKYLHVGKDPTTTAKTLNHLWFVKLSIDFEDPTEVRLLIRLMSSSPVLKELMMTGKRRGCSFESPAGSDSELWSEARNLGCELFQLKKMTMTASGSSIEIEFVKFVLLNSPALETLTLTPSSNLKDGNKKILVDLLRCRRASTKAEVVFCDG